MIVTDVAHMAEQTPLTPSMKKALEFLQKNNPVTLEEKKHIIDGENVYAMVSTNPSQAWSEGDTPLFEAHRKYIDVQYLATGTQVIGWHPIEKLQAVTDYDEKIEAYLAKLPVKGMTPVHLTAGQLVVLYPADAHAPMLAEGPSTPIKKVVIKVAVGT